MTAPWSDGQDRGDSRVEEMAGQRENRAEREQGRERTGQRENRAGFNGLDLLSLF